MPNYTFAEYLSRPPLITRHKYLIDPPNTGGNTYFHATEVWENDFDSYKLLLYGVLTDGQKALVEVKNSPVDFDVMIPEEYINTIQTIKNSDLPADEKDKAVTKTYQKFYDIIFQLLHNEKIDIKSCKHIPAQKTSLGFSEPLEWFRIGFAKLKDRVDALGVLKMYVTGWDDGGKFRAPNNGYPLKVARENDINLAGWNILSNYSIVQEGCPTIIEVEYNDIKAAPDYKQPIPCIVAYTDTEDNSSLGGGHISNPEIEGDDMFIITTSFYRPAEKTRLDNLTICQFKGYSANQLKEMIKPNDNILITCNNEYELLYVFIVIFGQLLPDLWIDFNGLDFDQKYFYHRMKRYPEIFIDNGQTYYKYWMNNARGGHKTTLNYADAIKTPDFRPVAFTLLDKFYNSLEMPFAKWKNDKSFFKYITNSSNQIVKDPMTFGWVKQNIKISPEKMVYGYNIQIAGMLYIDAKPTMMKLYPKESSSSLKHFLKIMKLPEKLDMPAIAMFALFKNAGQPAVVGGKQYTLQGLIDYASWDAEAIHQMFMKKSVFVNAVAEAALTKTSLYDSFYRANGMKARNLLMALGFKGVKDYFGRLIPVVFSVKYAANHPDDEDTGGEDDYGGGYVLEPRYTESGRTDEPVAPLDFSSLYPSITMAYNICHDAMIRTPEQAAKYAEKYKLKQVEFQINTVFGEGVNKKVTTKDVKVWVVQYRFAPEDGENMTPGQEWGMGIMPTILSRLKEERDAKKAEQKKIQEAIEERRKLKQPADDLEFEILVAEGVQKAIKVQMNTFYGECGNKLSPFYFIDIAASITALGRESLRTVISIAESKGFRVYYGDTDSVYSSAPKEIYNNIRQWHERALSQLLAGQEIEPPPLMDRKIAEWATKVTKNPYAMYPPWCIKIDKETKVKTIIGEENTMHPDIHDQAIDMDRRKRLLKEELYRRMVILAQNAVIGLEKYVNDQLVKICNCRRLMTAYEEVLFPMGLFGKKKYLGVQNVKPDCQLIGFDWMNPDNYFIRGIDFIKKGMPPIMKEIGEEILAKCLDIMETRSIREVVEDEISKFGTRAWKFESFTKTAEYKKHKKNIAVHNFAKRMVIEHAKRPDIYRTLEDGERFPFIYVKLAKTVSDFGLRIAVAAADRMQFPDVAAKLGQEVDLDAYMNGTFKGLLARFISYDKEFQYAEESADQPADEDPDDVADDDDEDGNIVSNTTHSAKEHVSDKKAIAAAQKHIAQLLKKAFGKDTVNLKQIKADVKTKFKNIEDKLPAHMHAAYEALVEYLKKIDQAGATGKSNGTFIQIISGIAIDQSKKLKFNTQMVFDGLLKTGMTRRKIYELFHGLTGPRNILKIRQTIIEKEKHKIAKQLEPYESKLSAINMDKLADDPAELESFTLLFNRYVWMYFQARVNIEVGNAAVEYRKIL